MRAYSVFKQELSKRSGVQRYKHTAVIDMQGVSMSMMMGAKRILLKKVNLIVGKGV